MVKVTGTELQAFADRYPAGYELPELVRRLIVSNGTVTRLDMPSGDGARRPGLDGRIRANKADTWVPAGDSVWELGTDKDVKPKAESDFKKRINSVPAGVNPARTTFVFVTPRRWDGKHDWETKKRTAGPWRDVRVLDADTLENWLDHKPDVALWFAAEHLGRPDARAKWPDIRIGWKPEALDPDKSELGWLHWSARLTRLYGREAERTELLRWVRQGGGISCRFLEGVGGAGKTRLAHEVADELAREGDWAAGLIDPTQPLPLHAGLKGCLLLIDYPEERQSAVRERLTELAQAPADPNRAVRILFLTRNGDRFWQPILDETGAHLRSCKGFALSDGIRADDAWSLFCEALTRVPQAAGSLKIAVPDKKMFDKWLGRLSINSRPLLVAAAAIQAVKEPENSVFDLKEQKVIIALVRREAARLRRLAMAHKEAYQLDEDALVRLTAIANVTGGLNVQAIERLAGLAALNLGSSATICDRLRRVGFLSHGFLPALEPDIVAAAFAEYVFADVQGTAASWIRAAEGDS